MKTKKSQEEMVGFVLIVVLVTVIALVFFVISIKKTPATLASNEIASFLESANAYSTDCYSSAERRLDIQDLIVSCYNFDKCMDNRSACNALNATLAGLMKESWKVGEDMPAKAYTLTIYDSNNKTILSLKEGICTGMMAGSFVNIPVYTGIIKETLEICS